MQRTIDFSVLPTVSAATLVAYVRRLIFAVQTAARVRRYAYLPTDVVWWTHTLSKSEDQLFNNVRDAVLPSGDEQKLEEAMAIYSNWSDANTNSRNIGIRTKMRLFVLFIRLCVLYVFRLKHRGQLQHERNVLVGLLCRRYEAYIEFERIEVSMNQRKALIVLVLAHYLILNTRDTMIEGWVRGLKQITEYYTQTERWAESGNVLRSLAAQMDQTTFSDAYAQMSTARLETALRGAYPRGEDMIADVLCYMLAEASFMKSLFGERRFKLALLFRLDVRKLAADPAQLVRFFLEVRNMHELVGSWSDRQAVKPERIFDYAVRALAVIHEIVEQRETIYGCYAHLMEQRHVQFAASTELAFEFPPPVKVPGFREAIEIEFLRDKTCLLSNEVADQLPFSIELEDRLGSGSNGVIFGIVDSMRVVKVTDFFTEAEYVVQMEAGKMGFGPRTYKRYHIPNVVVLFKDTEVFENISLIVSDRMYTTLLAIMYTQTDVDVMVQIVDAVLDLIQRFNDSNFVHHDMKPDNIMLMQRGADPTDTASWRLIDFGLSWYGGKEYDPTLMIKTETSEPYGWNPRTSTLEDPREVYGGWIHSTPPAFVPGWDRFCLLFALFTFTRIREKSVKVPFRAKVIERIQKLAETYPDNYAVAIDIAAPYAVTVTTKRDFCTYTRRFPLDNSPRDTIPWSRVCPYRDVILKGQYNDWRLFVPRNLLHQHGIVIVDRVGADAFTTCAAQNCNTIVRFAHNDDRATDAELLLRNLAKQELGPAVLVSDERRMPIVPEQAKKNVAGPTIRTLLFNRAGRTLRAVLDDLLDSVVLADVQSKLNHLFMSAFHFVAQLGKAGYVHHSLNADKLLYDEEHQVFFLVDCVDVWHEVLGVYNIGRRFTFRGVAMREPQRSLSAALLFTDVYNSFILDRVGKADRHIESELATFMRRRVYYNYLADAKECESQVLHDNGRIGVQYVYTDMEGQQQRMEI